MTPKQRNKTAKDALENAIECVEMAKHFLRDEAEQLARLKTIRHALRVESMYCAERELS